MTYQIEEKLLHVNEYTRPGDKIVPYGVVIHWTANEDEGADRLRHYKYFNNNKVKASAHYFVDCEGILRIIPENEMAYHVGAKHYKTTRFGTYPNAHLIGVEMCVNSDGVFSETYKRAVWVVADIIRRHKWDVDSALVRHFDITGKDCPKMFTHDSYAKKYMGMTAAAAYGKFRNDVKAALKGETTIEAPKKQVANVVVEAPVKTVGTYTGLSLASKVDELNFYSKPSWDKKDVVGTCNKGIGFPTILDKVKVDSSYQYKVANSKGDVFYITAAEKYVEVSGGSAPASKPVETKPSYVGKRVESKANGLRFYATPSWEDKDVAGRVSKGEGFPTILEKVTVGSAEQYKVKNSRGVTYYITASDTYVSVV